MRKNNFAEWPGIRSVMTANPFITLDDITVRVRDRWYLKGTSWQINQNEQWAIVGPNGSGKSTLVKAIMGVVPIVKGRITCGGNGSSTKALEDRVGYVSSEQHGEIIARENLEETFRDFSGSAGFTTARGLLGRSATGSFPLCPSTDPRSLPSQLGIEHLLERPVRALSAGELRRILIARALLEGPELLILDEPFEDLDAPSRRSLAGVMGGLVSHGVQIILITHRLEEIVDCITHVLYLKDGHISLKGSKEEILGEIAPVYAAEGNDSVTSDAFPSRTGDAAKWCSRLPRPKRDVAAHLPAVLVQMKDVTVRYGDVVPLDRFSWTVRQGENWALLGPNGAGKTTVLNLIMGNNLQSYANEIFLFGKKKGSGESIWDIKKHIGFVSADTNATYQQGITAFDVICSGFFDSVGLYRQCSDQQIRVARQWCRELGIEEVVDTPFDRLSYGERQLVLLARALVKSPRLLILDEPCSGLDPVNRKNFLRLLDYVGSQTAASLIYVTHHLREILPCITHRMRLERGRVVPDHLPPAPTTMASMS